MATNLRLDYEAASSQARIVEGLADSIDGILKDLVSNVEANVNNNSVWSGVSAGSFMTKWNECADNFNSFVNHVKTIQQKIDYTASEVSTFDNI
ncbi:MAG: hypothetical protein E7167_00660 [Firmicutes bacterium]|nr:hypothetical protein [Bacillota bacterium]